MRTIPQSEFESNVTKYLADAVVNGVYTKVETTNGVAVLIDEPEWSILVEALRMVLNGAEK